MGKLKDLHWCARAMTTSTWYACCTWTEDLVTLKTNGKTRKSLRLRTSGSCARAMITSTGYSCCTWTEDLVTLKTNGKTKKFLSLRYNTDENFCWPPTVPTCCFCYTSTSIDSVNQYALTCDVSYNWALSVVNGTFPQRIASFTRRVMLLVNRTLLVTLKIKGRGKESLPDNSFWL